MELNILLGGKAGQGINKLASIMTKLLAKKGYFTFNYRDYPSLIKGGHNFNIISISDTEIYSYKSKLDGIVALDQNTIKKHKKKLRKNGFLIKNEDIKTDKDFGKSFNMLFAGALIKKLGIEKDALEEVIKEEFKKYHEQNMEAVNCGYDALESDTKLENRNNKIKIMSGSEGTSIGAIKSGIDIYLAYPMTPATPVLHILASKQIDNNFLVFQPENEISTINMALGASHTGAKVMIGTSGGGYDLMQEAMSMQGIAEIPLVVYLAQRPGPGTGVPTYASQGDLHIATKSGHGEFPRVTIAPGDAVECVEKANEAFYFAEKYRLLTIILGDKHVAESEFSFTHTPKSIDIDRNIDTSETGVYENYKITKDGNSPRSVPGLNIVKATSYEHDEKGITIENADMARKMMDKRLRKVETINKEARKFDMYKIHGKKDAETLVIGWGSTKGAILDAIKVLNVKFLQILYLEPFPTEIEDILKKAKKVLLIENNATGLLGNLIAEKTGFLIEDKILKYDGRPFTSDKLKEQIKKRL